MLFRSDEPELIAEMMKTKYNIDWLKVNFVGIDETIRTLREIADYFDDDGLKQRTEEVIEEELADIAEEREFYRSKLTGKTAGIFVGGSRAHHYQHLLSDFGVKTVIAGYEFAHRDDYEGRDIIPDIKIDADSRNIEELAVEKDEKNIRLQNLSFHEEKFRLQTDKETQ